MESTLPNLNNIIYYLKTTLFFLYYYNILAPVPLPASLAASVATLASLKKWGVTLAYGPLFFSFIF